MNKKIVWYSLATLFAISWIYGLINPKELATGDTPISPLGFTIASLIFIALFTYLGKKAKPSDKFTPSKALHLREKTHLLHNVYEQTISPTVRNKRIFRKLKKLDNYTVIDIETTGLNIYTDTIIEIAAVRVRNGQPVAHFSTFINPHQPLTAKITQITGITDHNLRHAPELKRTLKKNSHDSSVKTPSSGTTSYASTYA